MKKLLSLLLAAILMVSLCVVAYADGAAVTLDDVKGNVTTVVIGKGLSFIPAGSLSVFPKINKVVVPASVGLVSPACGLKSGMSVETVGDPALFEGIEGVNVTQISEEDYDAWLAKTSGGKQGNGFIYGDGVILLQNYSFLGTAATESGSSGSSGDFVERYSGSDEHGSWDETVYYKEDPEKNPDAKPYKYEYHYKGNDGYERNETGTLEEHNDRVDTTSETWDFKTPDGNTGKGSVTFTYNDDYTERTASGSYTYPDGTTQTINEKQYWDSESGSWVLDSPSDQLA